MNRNILFYIKEKDYYKYLKENSFIIKDICRNNSVEYFIKYIKDKYKLRVSDKIVDAVDNVDIISSLIKELL